MYIELCYKQTCVKFSKKLIKTKNALLWKHVLCDFFRKIYYKIFCKTETFFFGAQTKCTIFIPSIFLIFSFLSNSQRR